MDQEYQNDFFQGDEMEAAEKRRLLRGKPIKKHQFHVILTYEHAALAGILSILIVSLFFLMGRWLSPKPAIEGMDVEARERGQATAEMMLSPIDVTPPESAAGEKQPEMPLVAATAITKESGKADSIEEKKGEILQAENVAPKEGWALQVAAFTSLERTKAEIANLQEKGFRVFDLPSGEHHQVCVGPYADKDEVLKVQKSLITQYKDAFLRKMK